MPDLWRFRLVKQREKRSKLVTLNRYSKRWSAILDLNNLKTRLCKHYKTGEKYFSFGRSLNTIDSLETSSLVNFYRTLESVTVIMYALYQTKNSEVVLVHGQCCGLDKTPSLISNKNPGRSLQRSSQETKQANFNPLHCVPVKGGNEVKLWGCCEHARSSHARLVTCDFLWE